LGGVFLTLSLDGDWELPWSNCLGAEKHSFTL
jgi:hypothetical protein